MSTPTSKPKKKDWTNQSITIPDWVAGPVLLAILLALSWWVSTWQLPAPFIHDADQWFYYAWFSKLGAPLVVSLLLGILAYAAWFLTYSAASPADPASSIHTNIRLLLHIEGLLQFNIPAARLAPLENPSIPPHIREYIALMQTGITPGIALAQICTTRVCVRIKNLFIAADSIGCLLPIVSAAITRFRHDIDTGKTQRLHAFASAPLVLATPILIVLTTVLLPYYLRRFEDIQLLIPPITQATFNFLHWFTFGGHMLGIPNVPILNLPGCVWLALLLLAVLCRANPFYDCFLFLWRRPFMLRAPWAGRIIADHDWASVYTLLSLAIARGIPLPQAIASANLPDLNLAIKARLSAWQTNITTGQSPAHASFAADMPDRLTAVLTLAATNKGLAQALSHLAQFHQNRADHELQKFAPLVPISLTLLSGFVVGLLVLGFADAASAISMHIQTHWH